MKVKITMRWKVWVKRTPEIAEIRLTRVFSRGQAFIPLNDQLKPSTLVTHLIKESGK